MAPPQYGLDKKLTRLEALVLVIRLMGLDEVSKAYSGTNIFTDIPAWGDRYAAYAYNTGITSGVDSKNNLFAPDKPVALQEFTALLLRVLEYKETNGDFNFEQAIQKGIDAGLFNLFGITAFSSDEFLRGHAVLEIANALKTKPKGKETLLIYRLTDYGLFSRSDAGWFVDNIK